MVARTSLTVTLLAVAYPSGTLACPVVVHEAYLKPAEVGISQNADEFGQAVAVSGDTLVVGAPREDSGVTGAKGIPDESAFDSGAVYVFVREGGVWRQQAFLKPEVDAPQWNDAFGHSVALSGDTLVVGAPKEDSSATGINNPADNSSSNSGAAYVFVREGSNWSQQAFLKPAAVGLSQAGDHFGWSVGIAGDTVIVGALYEDGATPEGGGPINEDSYTAGAAYVFVREGSTWSQQAYLKATPIGSSQSSDLFGFSVAVSGDSAVVGAPLENSGSTGVNSEPDESADHAGAAYVFVRNGTTWAPDAYLKANASELVPSGDRFGQSVAISGDLIVVGAPRENSISTGVNNPPEGSGNAYGAAYVFRRSAGDWYSEAYLKPLVYMTREYQFGDSVAISGQTVVVGASSESGSATGVNGVPDTGATYSGAAYVFVHNGTTWVEKSYLKPAVVGETQSTDRFGESVAVSDSLIAVGAAREDSSSVGINGVPDEGALDAGAAHAFFISEGATAGFAIRSIAIVDGRLRIEMPPVDGEVGLEFTDDLEDGAWVGVGSFAQEGESLVFIDPEPSRGPFGFYRAVLRPAGP